MKVTTKEGDVIECTVTEYLMLKGISEQPVKVEKEVSVETTRKHRGKYNAWSKQDIELLKNNYHKGYAELLRMFPNRTMGTISGRLSKMGLKVSTAKKKKVGVYDNDKQLKGSYKRIKFINNRAKQYVDKYGWDYTCARTKASADWNNNKSMTTHKIKQVSDDDLVFPNIYPIVESEMYRLEEIVRSMLGNSGKISYFDVTWLNLVDDLKWSGHLWRDFIISFLANSSKISKAFNVENKFKTTKDSHGFDVIIYGGVKQ